jgi:eukaryotic-like serine/threonine-protein kinase
VGEGPELEEPLMLEPLPEPPRREEPLPEPPRREERRREERRPEPPRAATEPRPQEVRKSLVRFVVKPVGVWATVSCNGRLLGDTPFGDKELAIGSHECKFSNPELGTRSRRIDVKPNAHNTVVVEF